MRSPSTSISSEMSRRDWPYLIAPALRCSVFQVRSSVSDFTGAEGPSEPSHLLKSRFIPYLNTTEQSASFPFELLAPPQVLQSRRLLAVSLLTTLGISAGSTITAPWRLSISTASAMTLACSALSPPRG